MRRIAGRRHDEAQMLIPLIQVHMLSTFFHLPITELVSQLLLSLLLGALIGVERKLAHKTAGMRTFALVSLGSTIFSLISIHATQYVNAMGRIEFDPTRIAAQIVTGVGFIGAGIIFFDQSRVRGVTTAAGLWLASAIGMAVAFGFYMMAIIATLLTLFIFVIFYPLERRTIERLRILKNGK